MGEPGRGGGNTAMKSLPWLLATPGDLEMGRTVLLDAAEARHLTGALRRRPGDEIVLVDGNGSVAEAKLVAVSKKRVEAEIESVRIEPKPHSLEVTVALATVENRSMDWAVQKAVEVGVGRFIPVQTERAQIRGKDLASRVEHWRRIAMQALKQCRRPWAMVVDDVVFLAKLVETSEEGGVFADREGCPIGDLPEATGGLLLVGPEGGFTATEHTLFDRHGWQSLRLGPHILRAETAAVVGGAMMVARQERNEGRAKS
jgi:16S rRNA (uracil1498-N3)-methyltransferase